MTRLLTIFVLVFAAAIALPCDALADGKADVPKAKGKSRDWVSKLDAKELESLKSRTRWEKLPAKDRQRMARMVVILRKMPEDKRQEFLRRARDWRGKRDHVRSHAGHMLASRGLAQAALKRLGPKFENELRKRDLSHHAFERAFQMTFWKNSVRGDRRQFWKKVQQQVNKWREELAGAAGDPRTLIEAIAARAIEAHPEAFEKSVSNPEQLIRKTESVEVHRGIRRLMRRTDRLSKDESRLLVRLVDRWAVKNRKSAGAAGEQADAILKSVLVNELGVSQEIVDGMPPRSDPEARARYFQQQMRRAGFHKHHGKMRGKSGRRALRKPDGISEKDWKLIMQARQNARRDGKFFQRMDERPEGVSDEGWKAWKDLEESVWRRMEGRRNR